MIHVHLKKVVRPCGQQMKTHANPCVVVIKWIAVFEKCRMEDMVNQMCMEVLTMRFEKSNYRLM